MPTYNITEIATGRVALTYTNDVPLHYGRADWDDPALFTHVAVEDPPPPPRPPKPPMTKWAFRSLFTLAERVACDNAQDNAAIPAEYRAMLRTMNLDFSAAEEIDPSLQEVQDGVRLLETLGLLGAGRADDILLQ
jgi:hypothetical protein